MPTDTPARPYDHVRTIDTMLDALRAFAMHGLLVPDADVTRARETVATADAIGFVIDPTKYRDALYSGSLRRQGEIVALFAQTRAKLAEIFPNDKLLELAAKGAAE